MTQQEMTQLTSDLYMGKLTLDANSYRTASQKLTQHLASEKDTFAAAQLSHVKSVQAAQNQMQMSDVVFASPATGGLTVPEGIHSQPRCIMPCQPCHPPRQRSGFRCRGWVVPM